MLAAKKLVTSLQYITRADGRASHLSLDRSEIKTVILVDNYNPKYSPRIYAFRVSTA